MSTSADVDRAPASPPQTSADAPQAQNVIPRRFKLLMTSFGRCKAKGCFCDDFCFLPTAGEDAKSAARAGEQHACSTCDHPASDHTSRGLKKSLSMLRSAINGGSISTKWRASDRRRSLRSAVRASDAPILSPAGSTPSKARPPPARSALCARAGPERARPPGGAGGERLIAHVESKGTRCFGLVEAFGEFMVEGRSRDVAEAALACQRALFAHYGEPVRGKGQRRLSQGEVIRFLEERRGVRVAPGFEAADPSDAASTPRGAPPVAPRSNSCPDISRGGTPKPAAAEGAAAGDAGRGGVPEVAPAAPTTAPAPAPAPAPEEDLLSLGTPGRSPSPAAPPSAGATVAPALPPAPRVQTNLERIEASLEPPVLAGPRALAVRGRGAPHRAPPPAATLRHPPAGGAPGVLPPPRPPRPRPGGAGGGGGAPGAQSERALAAGDREDRSSRRISLEGHEEAARAMGERLRRIALAQETRFAPLREELDDEGAEGDAAMEASGAVGARSWDQARPAPAPQPPRLC
eukprot:tig00020943_g16314.t1